MKFAWLKVSLVLMFLVILGMPHTVFAEKVSKEELMAVRDKKYHMLDEIAAQNIELKKYVDQMKQAENEISKIQITMAPVEERLTKAQADAKVYEKLFHDRITLAYKQGEMNYLSHLLSAETFTDFIHRYDSVRMVVKQDHRLLQKRMEIVQQIETEKAKYDKLIDQMDEQVQKSKQAYQQLLEQQKGKKAELAKLEDLSEMYQDELIRINLYEWKQGKLKRTYPGSLQWPVPSHVKANSEFNLNRIHPIYKYKRPHRGMDFAAPYNTPIYAATDGVVVASQPASGYGWLVVIYHGEKNGKSVFTCYGHSERKQIKVRVGEDVMAGQTIAGVGSNGDSTGNHLHFEVRYGNGIHAPAVNPRNWF
ncbi:murein hydrolase activator EnvC family protein [Hazenella coriacea]|uniref:Peptidase M23-like protein n=1 Tax=Hazenella coriacea TaxID=1179467 RepID=A0A4R3L6Y5_9BACL|nr:M23 family metallopeptidase [Hazenella coriacea]TCS95671.1 peptidase M23-like protein [Hazenella coriacea]